ncbi:hypothetical protein BOVA604_5057 [Bacteroides ovatus]|jgi:hypothetical protein bacD2_06240|uniref:hypothetical protein n=1 Tax=Bacteroides TaxID=816 RepID=UPI000E9EF2B1|nr:MULTISPECIES: hypothetical protein [Bacteroides]MCS3177141.1 hypothetical protein [Candidatus Bacteroides intestinigallinarum]RGN58531.1 hypothetical protein DXB58_14920 [Bacteroides sp. OM05-10AA]RGQ63729.1 hypothetical protein DWY87_16160 [Bacteroides sp. AF27-33]CAG9903253.1 hypothetical protein BOVA604_5057 [Bacteroides ovatus]
MKNFLFLIAVTLVIAGCSNDKQEEIIEQTTPQEIIVTFDYYFWESGSMTKSTGNELYTTFYNKYIKNKTLTPRSYALTLKNLKTGESSYIRGYWNKKEGVKLMEGTYEVTGTSSPIYNSYLYQKLDTVYLAFKENIAINSNTTSVNLSAKYNSFMLMFDTDNTKSIEYGYGENSSNNIALSKVDNIYYMFLDKLSIAGNDRLRIKRTSGSESNIGISKTPFENGKYYYFNDITNSFDVPPMEQGN